MPVQTMTNQRENGHLAALRRASERVVVTVLWLHGPLVALAGCVTGKGLLIGLLLWSGIMSVVVISHRMHPGAPTTRAICAAALCLMPALLVFEFSGHPWQSDVHILFFVELALATMLLDEWATIAGGLTIAVHHLVLNFVLPALVFPDGADLTRVLLHAAVVACECGALGWLISKTEAALSAAEASGTEVSRLADLRREEQERFQAHRERQRATLEEDVQTIGGVISQTLGSLSASITSMDEIAFSVSGSVERTCVGNEAIARAAEESALQLGEVVVATEALSASADAITKQLAAATVSARASVAQARSTGATVRGLSEAVGQIGNVVRLISDIAGRTNLLALNATIEAARAGDAGKGFAVVASEVKLLANQTAKATETIRSQISAICTATDEAVSAVDEVGQSIIRMDDDTSAIATAIEVECATMREVTEKVQAALCQGNDSSREMREICKVAEFAKQATDKVLTVGDEIGNVSRELREKVDDFFVSLRTRANEQRLWARVPGGQAPVSIIQRDGSEVDVELQDISTGGAAVTPTAMLSVGDAVEVRLPGEGNVVKARVQRRSGNTVGLQFQQDEVALARIDRTIAAIGAPSAADPEATQRLG